MRALAEWVNVVADLLPDRMGDLVALVDAGLDNPAPTPNRNGGDK